MVYIHIPEALTEEEQMLMGKYAKLKKKVRSRRISSLFICFHEIFFLEKTSASTQK
jgi:hypothetical protein